MLFVAARWHAKDPSVCVGKGALRPVADAVGDDGDSPFAPRQCCAGKRQTPGTHIGERGLTHTARELGGECGSRHASHAGDQAAKKAIGEQISEIAIPPDAIARGILYAVEQPPEVDVGSIVIRPTAQG